MSDQNNGFPDFFYVTGPLPYKVTPLAFGDKTCWKLTLETSDKPQEQENPQLEPYLDNDDDLIDCMDMEETHNITYTKSGKFQTSMYVPSSLFSFIIGAKGSKLKALQNSTNTSIKVPRINEKGDIIIEGNTERQVASAKTQIDIIIAQGKERMPPTHFVSIPIKSDMISSNLLKFKKSVLEQPARGITESIFQKDVKMHLTVVMLKLLDEGEVTRAINILQSCYANHISKIFEKPQKAIIQGLEIMNDDPSNVNVLYAEVKIQNPEKLQTMCDTIANYFNKAGLAKKEYDRVKLHMTVMNKSFRHESEQKMSFDASKILESHKDFYFGEFELNQLDLCIRGTTTSNTGEMKYYDTALTIQL
ncbi:unnamed protein product [Ceutorhynchus assimilis]|uniref:K Homology domain-containing protein n=1 Tax=Ceutorhynchus assimilis TaxID=467358 RepID=A0A9N9MMU9_9CUCU|nr:unnamed protein product [Ceutorhynchus assimilis]